MATEFLAGSGLLVRQRARGSDVCDHDQGRHLYLLRLWTLLFSGQAGASAFFGGDWLIFGGMATIFTAAIAIIAAQRLERLASLSILVSAGILLSAIGFAQPSLTSGALFYLVSSTLALSAMFLLGELIERSRSANEIPLEEDADQLPRAVCIRRPAPTWTTSKKSWSARSFP